VSGAFKLTGQGTVKSPNELAWSNTLDMTLFFSRKFSFVGGLEEKCTWEMPIIHRLPPSHSPNMLLNMQPKLNKVPVPVVLRRINTVGPTGSTYPYVCTAERGVQVPVR
jgi:hypothetical protein